MLITIDQIKQALDAKEKTIKELNAEIDRLKAEVDKRNILIKDMMDDLREWNDCYGEQIESPATEDLINEVKDMLGLE